MAPRLTDSAPASNQNFTSIKLTWVNCIMAITTLTPFDKCVAIVIAQAINEKTRCWKLSDELIAILAGKPGAVRSVQRSRRRLRAGGWLTWRRTGDANEYRLRHDNVMEALDEIMRQKMERRTRRRRPKATPESCLDTTPESPLHTRGTHSEERRVSSESERFLSLRNISEVRNSPSDSELAEALKESTEGEDKRAQPQFRLMRVVGGVR